MEIISGTLERERGEGERERGKRRLSLLSNQSINTEAIDEALTHHWRCEAGRVWWQRGTVGERKLPLR